MRFTFFRALAPLAICIALIAGAQAADPIASLERDLDDATTLVRAQNGSSWSWHGGVEATYLKADVGGESFVNDVEVIDFKRNFETAPRVWLGVENESGLGLVGRLWDYDSEAHFKNLTIDIDDNTIEGAYGNAHLEARAIDLELTKRFDFANWDMLGSFGARYGKLRYDQTSTQDFWDDGDEVDTSTIFLNRTFEGTGITTALNGSRPLVTGSVVHAFWNVRGSVLWGSNKADIATIDTDTDTDGDIDIDTDTDGLDEGDTLVIGEVQLGLEGRQPLAYGNGEVFIRAAIEYQVWDTDPTSLTGFDFTGANDSLGDNELQLFGGTIAVGITR